MITLISPYADVTSLGPRSLSSYLRRHGFPTRLIFLPFLTSEIEYRADFTFRYDDALLDQISCACEGSLFVGISLMTNYYHHAVDLTRRIRKDHPAIPIVWGGIHPTLSPSQCIEEADLVCRGEGEAAIVELAERLRDGAAIDTIENFWVKRKDGTVAKNEPRTLIPDLDELPDPDYDPDEQFARDPASGRLVSVTDELLERLLVHDTATKHRSRSFYQTVTSRGCPYVCSFCCWSALNPMYKGDANFRRRSHRSVIDELVRMRKRIPFIESITFSDDQFMVQKAEELRAFGELYKKEVGLPFQILAGPSTVTRDKMDALVDAGLRNIQIGVQTFSQRTQREVYHRKLGNDKVLRCAEILADYRGRIAPPIYDFILDNPWEKDEDLIESLRFIIDLPRPYYLQIFSLVFFPGTEIHRMAKEEGKLPASQEQVYVSQYNNRKITYLNMMFSLASHNWPRPLLRLLISRPALAVLNRRPLNSLYRKLYDAYRFAALLPHRLKRGSPIPEPQEA